MVLPESCLRCLSTCKPLASLEDVEGGFICVGRNDGSEVKDDRKQDIYTYCWLNDQIDERTFMDRRDIVDSMSVMAQALSVIENGVVN